MTAPVDIIGVETCEQCGLLTTVVLNLASARMETFELHDCDFCGAPWSVCVAVWWTARYWPEPRALVRFGEAAIAVGLPATSKALDA